MNNHLSEDELVLHYYGETDGADEARVESHLASCSECQFANQQLRQVMTLVDSATPVAAPPGFERTAWARLEPELDRHEASWKTLFLVRRSAKREGGWFPQWALAGGVAALVLAAFVAGRFTGSEPSGITRVASPVAQFEPEKVLETAVGDHLERSQMMLVELANADSDQSDVFAAEQERAADLVAVNRLIRQSVEQSGDAAVAEVLEDLERLLLEIANAPANASSNELTGLQSRITTEDLLFRVRVIASEMRQRTMNDREAGDRVPQKKQPIS
jgi:anti-sigma factor RsiW